MKSCKTCKHTEFNCLILRKLKQADTSFYIGGEFVYYGEFYCSKWEKNES